MSPAPAGFRLRRVELRNWGTFNGDCHYVMNLACASACLTGLNGSGKSTLIDALLTLLVPHEFRNYNVAATGAGAKRERTPKTYILGAYGKEESSESNRGQSRFLRKPGTISVLLAVFHDAVFNKSVTLLQLHWITASGEHAARYLCKEAEGSIANLGIGNLAVTAFKDHFEKTGWSYETTFEPYEGRFIGLLRIPSRQALKLLCRTVSVKDVPSVTEFIRTLMLEPFPVEKNLDAIETHFSDLDRIHTQLEETTREIELLKPIAEHHVAYQVAHEETQRLDNVKRAAEIVLARDAGLTVDAEVATLERRKSAAEAEIARLKGDLGVIEQRIIELKVSMRQDETGAAIERLQAEEKKLSEELIGVRRMRDTLRQWLTALGRPDGVPPASEFDQLKTWAATQKQRSDEQMAQAMKASGAKSVEARAASDAASSLADEIRGMDGKRDKIPGVFRGMRHEICEDLKLDEAALPFVGELLDVSAAESAWRESLEVLLHGFALSVLVPQEHYQRFSAYVEKSKFRKRLVYFSVPKGTGASVGLDSGKAYGKIVIRPDAWCRAWLQERLISNFPHRCANTMEEFWREDGPAITKNRHLKGGARHVKEGTDSERDYDLLGWSNTAKLETMRKKLDLLHQQARTLKTEADTLEKTARGFTSGMALLDKVVAIPSYRSLDEAGVTAELTAATDRRCELEDTNEKWKTLNATLQEAIAEQAIVGKQHEAAITDASAFKTEIKNWQEKRKDYARTFNAAALAEFDWKPLEPEVDAFRRGEPLVIRSLDRQIRVVLDAIASDLQAQREAKSKAERPLLVAIGRFLDATKLKGYSSNWNATAETAPALVAHLNHLVSENFHTQQKEFTAMMRKVLLDDLRVGDGDLQVQSRANRDRIAELNTTLSEIPYNEETRIQIVTRPSREHAVLTYRAKLEECTKHSVAMSNEQLAEKFKAVKALVTYIREKRSEAEKGANPNNWDTFALLEAKPGDDPKLGEWHSDADGNSGGQKAKLACTIVAAAMAFQLKHTRTRQSNAFRLVMVDEIFSKSDDVNSGYALAIFEKFDFQLLLVTPRDGRLKLVQPYVGSFHLAQNPHRNASSITSMTRLEVANATTTPDEDA